MTPPEFNLPLLPVPEDIPGVLSIDAPKAPLVPLVFDSPHSGLDLPVDFHPAVDADAVRVSADTHVDDLFAAAPDYGAPLLRALFPRSFLDVNRSLSDMDVSMVDGQWPYPTRSSNTAKRGMGLIWRKAWDDTAMYDRPLTIAQARNRILTYWLPYHCALRRLLDASYGQFRTVYHINCHSMTNIGHTMSSDGKDASRPDICIGVLYGRSAGSEFTDLLCEILRDEGFVVEMNKPFRGAELTEAYSNPAIGRHSVQFEINRRMYMDETTREKAADFATFKAVMTRLSEKLPAYAKDKTS